MNLFPCFYYPPLCWENLNFAYIDNRKFELRYRGGLNILILYRFYNTLKYIAIWIWNSYYYDIAHYHQLISVYIFMLYLQPDLKDTDDTGYEADYGERCDEDGVLSSG